MALYRSSDYQTSFESVELLVPEKKFNIDFQDGGNVGHLEFPIRTIFDHLDAPYQVSSQLAQGCRRSMLLMQIVDATRRMTHYGH